MWRAAHVLRARAERRCQAALLRRGLDSYLPRLAGNAIRADPCDLMHLYHAVRRLKPGRVLEFGSGHSTVVIAAALIKNGQGRLWTCDESPAWLEHTLGLLDPWQRACVTPVPCTLQMTAKYVRPLIRYCGYPHGPWDFENVDGPGDPRAVDGS